MDDPAKEDNPTLTIEFNPTTGECRVNGPIKNKLLSYGMLELARDAIRNLKEEPAIVPVNGDRAERFRARGG